MILRLAYILFFAIAGLIALGVDFGKWAFITMGLSGLLIAISMVIGPASAPVAPGNRRWLW